MFGHYLFSYVTLVRTEQISYLCGTYIRTLHIFVRNTSSDIRHHIFVCNIGLDILHFPYVTLFVNKYVKTKYIP